MSENEMKGEVVFSDLRIVKWKKKIPLGSRGLLSNPEGPLGNGDINLEQCLHCCMVFLCNTPKSMCNMQLMGSGTDDLSEHRVRNEQRDLI